MFFVELIVQGEDSSDNGSSYFCQDELVDWVEAWAQESLLVRLLDTEEAGAAGIGLVLSEVGNVVLAYEWSAPGMPCIDNFGHVAQAHTLQ